MSGKMLLIPSEDLLHEGLLPSYPLPPSTTMSGYKFGETVRVTAREGDPSTQAQELRVLSQVCLHS